MMQDVCGAIAVGDTIKMIPCFPETAGEKHGLTINKKAGPGFGLSKDAYDIIMEASTASPDLSCCLPYRS